MSAIATELDHVRVRFATFRDANADERVVRARHAREIDAEERVVLDTCHRVELITVDQQPVERSALRGRAAIHRVFAVTAGFDSAVIAEEQLLGQVRRAYEDALAAGSTGPILNELLRRAIRFGRRVRSHALPGADRSLADRGSRWIASRLRPGQYVLVVGTGEMGRRTAQRLAEAGNRVTIASRSAERAASVVGSLAGSGHVARVGPVDAETLRDASAVVIASRGREPALTDQAVAGSVLPWVLDLSQPPATSQGAAAILGERLMTLDQLAALEGRTPVLAPDVERRLRHELDMEVDGFVRWLDSRRSSGAVASLRRAADGVRRRHLDRLRRDIDLAPDQLTAVEAASAAMLNELLHRPTVALRRGGPDADAVRRLLELDGHR